MDNYRPGGGAFGRVTLSASIVPVPASIPWQKRIRASDDDKTIDPTMSAREMREPARKSTFGFSPIGSGRVRVNWVMNRVKREEAMHG